MGIILTLKIKPPERNRNCKCPAFLRFFKGRGGSRVWEGRSNTNYNAFYLVLQCVKVPSAWKKQWLEETVTPLILTAFLWGRFYCCPHVREEESKHRGIDSSFQSHTESGWAGFHYCGLNPEILLYAAIGSFLTHLLPTDQQKPVVLVRLVHEETPETDLLKCTWKDMLFKRQTTFVMSSCHLKNLKIHCHQWKLS